MKFTTYTSHIAAAALKAGHAVSVVLNANPGEVSYFEVGKHYPLTLTGKGVPAFIDDDGDECKLTVGIQPKLEAEAVFHDLTDEEALALFPRDQTWYDVDGNTIHPGDRVEFIHADDVDEAVEGKQGMVLPILGELSPGIIITALMNGQDPHNLVIVEISDDTSCTAALSHIRRVQLC